MKATSFKTAAISATLMFVPLLSHAFALLGPVEPWMAATNGLNLPGDIGGPMDLAAEYRWNTPVITYSFDASFVNFFGSNGVAAVNSAIQILNDLPPASQMVLTNYPLQSENASLTAQSLNLYDLKSEALSLLMEQLGLASPTRSVYQLHGWDPHLFNYDAHGSFYVTVSGSSGETDAGLQDPGHHVFDFVVHRNFDPTTFSPSYSVNGELYGAAVQSYLAGSSSYYPAGFNGSIPFAADPFSPTYTAVADFPQGTGQFFTGLTRDDVGGLGYLLATNNYNVESLLPDVHGTGTNAADWVDVALRGGVDKVTFVQEPISSFLGTFFSPVTNRYTDTYLTNSVLKQQQLERVTYRPDIVFSADETGTLPGLSIFTRTGTTNWINNAALNGNPAGAGPGVIRPGINITFSKVGYVYWSQGTADGPESVSQVAAPWSSFDGSTNAPILYPAGSPGIRMTQFELRFRTGTNEREFIWQIAGGPDSVVAMQMSTNLVDWTNAFTVPNEGGFCQFYVVDPASSKRFYRFVAQ